MELSRNILLPVRQLKETVHGIIDDSLMQELMELEDKISASRFNLVVLGMFKRGKSTLINKLLEKNVAPVGVIPLTAIITLFEYASDRYAEIIFMNGTKQRISPEEIEEYVTENNNPENKKGVRYVKIFDNIPLLRQIHLVDTPGLGSEFEHNTRTTLSFIPKVDAALFVMSADTPVSHADLELLGQLQRSVSRILYVLNKADLLPPGELEVLEEYNKKAIAMAIDGNRPAGAGENDPEWFTLSAKPDNIFYRSIKILRERLLALSGEEKKSILEISVRNRFTALFSEVEMQVRLQLDTLEMPLHVLEEKQKNFHGSLERLQSRRSEFEHIMRGRVARLQQEIDREIKACDKMLKQQLYEQLILHPVAAYSQMKKQGYRSFQDDLVKNIIGYLEQAKQALEQQTRQQFTELLDEYCSRSQSFVNELAVHLQSLLGIDYHRIAGQFDLNAYTAFYFDHGRGENPVYLKPSFLLQKTGNAFLTRSLMKKIYRLHHQLIITNTSGVIYDLQYKIQESFRKFNYDLDQHLDKLLHRIEKVITDTLKARSLQIQSTESQKQKLKNALDKLAAIPH